MINIHIKRYGANRMNSSAAIKSCIGNCYYLIPLFNIQATQCKLKSVSPVSK